MLDEGVVGSLILSRQGSLAGRRDFDLGLDFLPVVTGYLPLEDPRRWIAVGIRWQPNRPLL